MREKRIVIIGAGFGGLQAARSLRGVEAEITVVDRRNYHLFQPFLYQVATSALSGSDIAAPIRYVLRKQRNTEVAMSEVVGIDPRRRRVLFEDGSLDYDYLVLATGSRHSYFGHDEWERFAPGLKSIEDALAVRSRVLSAFERAERQDDPEARDRLLTIVLVGAGATGVEMAGSLAVLTKKTMRSSFRRINTATARIVLVEAASRILGAFPEELAAKARAELESVGVEIRTNAKVDKIDERGVRLGTEWIQAETILWTAGVAASPAGRWLGAETDRAGRVKVGEDLTVPGHPDIWVIGDTAHAVARDGKPLPGVAPVALQQGRFVAESIRERLARGEGAPPRRFQYRDKGNLATTGKVTAIADLKFGRFNGRVAWLLWAAVHIFYLITFRNRLLVMIKWAFLFLTYQRPERLIISGERPAKARATERNLFAAP